MSRVPRFFAILVLLAMAGVLFAPPQPAAAQIGRVFGPGNNRFELDPSVQVDRADSGVRNDLERVSAYLDDQQWDDAVETLRGLMEKAEGKLIGVTEHRYVGIRDYGHLQLANLPSEALELYRSRIDSVARKWYEQGVARRDRRLLQKVVEQAFASSFGDDALMALGEIALEAGDYTTARWYWERIIPASLPEGTVPTWPGYPDTDLDLAAVRARLVLVSILEGSTDRARDDLAAFSRLHGDARGRFGGREVNYAEALQSLLDRSSTWPSPKPQTAWPTFAGSAARNTIAGQLIDVGEVAWRIPLVPAVSDDAAPLSFHPLFVRGLVIVNNRREILAARLADGAPAWQGARQAIYRAPLETVGDLAAIPSNTFGQPQYTMTEFEGKLYARMGSPVTSEPQDRSEVVEPGQLICLDLAEQAKLVWGPLKPESGWAFEGSPVTDGQNVYVATRRSDVRPQAHVACLDAQTGRLRWRRFICGAETPARSILHQTSHNLLTLKRETLYVNTNLGAVAALSAHDGSIRWVSLYPRARQVDLQQLAPHWQRDLNPCVYDRGLLLVAPGDSPRIFAFDAATGQILWQTGTEVEDAVHLLGTSEKHLVAAGKRLYWIALQGEQRGRVKHVWPDSAERPGHGRGLIAGNAVLWPTHEPDGDKIRIFDLETAQPKQAIPLRPRGIESGNLLVADGRLLIATAKELIALRRQPGQPSPPGGEVTLHSPSPPPARSRWESKLTLSRKPTN